MVKSLHYFISAFCLIAAMMPSSLASGYGSESSDAASIKRISPEEARSKVLAGDAILVCSYNDEKCKDMLLEGALLRSEFEQKVPSLSKEQEIIFYCN